MRVISFVLLGLLFLLAVENFLKDREKAATARADATTASVGATAVPIELPTSSLGLAAAPVSLTATPATAAGLAGAPVSVTATPATAVACVHRADGATICGPVIRTAEKTTSSPFVQPAVAQPIVPSPLPVKPKAVKRQTAHDSERNVRAPKYSYRPAPPSEPERHPSRRTTREDARPLNGGPDRQSSPVVEHKQSVRYKTADVRHLENQPEPTVRNRVAERERAARRYGADRGPPLSFDREPPVRYSTPNLRGHEDERESLLMVPPRERAARRYDGDRGSPPLFERRPPVRYSAANHRHEDESTSVPLRPERPRGGQSYSANSNFPAPSSIHRERPIQFADLERRTLKLERELRALRADRAAVLGHGERSDVGGRFYAKPPPDPRVREPRQGGEPSTFGQLITHSALGLGGPATSDRDQQPGDRYRQPIRERQ